MDLLYFIKKQQINCNNNNQKNDRTENEKEIGGSRKNNFGERRKEEPVLLGQKFVLVDLAAATFGGIAGALLPLVGHDHFRQLLLALLVHHSWALGGDDSLTEKGEGWRRKASAADHGGKTRMRRGRSEREKK